MFTKENMFAKKPVADLIAQAGEDGAHTLKRGLGWFSLTLLGIGGVIGAGIFVLTGQQAALNAGPGIVWSFVIAGVVCAFAALCYAELASSIPVAGSAYTYTYATLGEFFAWIIAWDLLLEYGIAAATVSAGWSGYFNKMLAGFGMGMPSAWSTAPLDWVSEACPASWPSWLAFCGHLEQTGSILNVPAFCIVALMGVALIAGISKSALVNNLIVSLKVLVVLIVIAVGFSYVDPANWSPMVPDYIPPGPGESTGHFGWSGVTAAASIIFFAYIGFEAVSTAAQEAKNPQKTMPIGILLSLGICTVLYILMALVITGVVNYTTLDPKDAAPVATVLGSIQGLGWLTQLVNVAVAIGLGSTILSLLYGQSRVFFAMSRDGLLPPAFSRINPLTRVPAWGTVAVSLFAAVLGGLFPIKILGELVSMGTLLAFGLICIGVLYLRVKHPELPRAFRTPAVWLVAPAGAIGCAFLIYKLPPETWPRLIIWLLIGLVLYFGYAYRHSRNHQRRMGG